MAADMREVCTLSKPYESLISCFNFTNFFQMLIKKILKQI